MKEKDLIFGFHAIVESLRAGNPIDKIFIQREMALAKQAPELWHLVQEQGVTVVKVPQEKLNSLTRKNHQGIVAIASPVNFVALDNLVPGIFERGENPLILVLDHLTDVRNFGAILRTAECCGVHAVVIPERGGAPVNSDAMKTSSGALNYVPICKEKNLLTAVQFLQDSGLQIVACTEKAERTLYQLDFTQPTALIMGSEETGIAMELLRKADVWAKIPMLGQIGSLNVSVSAGVFLYEVVRHRLG